MPEQHDDLPPKPMPESTPADEARRSRMPNIVVIIADDMGPWAAGFAGNHEIRTPNLDKLARQGIAFPRFYCASPVCSPSRASILTGMMPSMHGVQDWLQRGNIDGEKWGIGGNDRPIEYLAGFIGYTDHLAENGYTVGLSGKWHLGDSARTQKGFSHWFAHTQSGGHYYIDSPMFRNGQIEKQDGYLTEAITDDAIEFMASHRQGSPFCAEIHYTAPHSPWLDCHPRETVDSYASCPFDTCPDIPAHPWQVASAPRGVGQQRRDLLAGYFAAITEMDRGIGRVIDSLDTWGIRNETLVFFCSDNGMCMGHHGVWGKGNGTFPQNMYEESVRVPAVVSMPGTVPEGMKPCGIYSHYDWFPTILDFCGISDPLKHKMPGRSFAGLLRGTEDPGREETVVFDEYGPVRMVCTKDWKYVHRFPYGPHELYNLAKDPGETRNLADTPEHETRVAEMRRRLEDFFLRFVDPAIDGVRQPVTGNGQIDRPGPLAQGPRSFNTRHQYCDANGCTKMEDNRWGHFPAV